VAKEVLPFLLRTDGEAQNKRRKETRAKPKAHERKVAAAIGGRRQRGSGAFEDKGDVAREERSFPLLVECKRTSDRKTKTIRIDSVWLSKVTQEAHARDAYPALSIEFDDDVVRALPGSPEATWVALPLSVMQGLLEKAGEDPL